MGFEAKYFVDTHTGAQFGIEGGPGGQISWAFRNLLGILGVLLPPNVFQSYN